MNFSKDNDRNNTYTNCSACGDKSKDLEIFKHADLLKLLGVRR